MTGFRSEIYKAAAEEHVKVAGELYNSERYVLCCYVAGLSVECLLRAYRVHMDPEFHAKHDQRLLNKTSGWFEYIPENSKDRIVEAINDLWVIWENAHRFRSLKDYRRFLHRRGLHQGVRGDFVKERSRQALTAAKLIVSIGAMSWPHA